MGYLAKGKWKRYMPDELKQVEIRLYFPKSLVLSANQYQNTRYRDLICTVELLRYGRKRNSQPELAAQGIVRHMRIITIRDKHTLEWIYFDNLEKKVFRQLQTALANEVCEKLQLQPKRLDPLKIAPKDMLLSLSAWQSLISNGTLLVPQQVVVFGTCADSNHVRQTKTHPRTNLRGNLESGRVQPPCRFHFLQPFRSIDIYLDWCGIIEI